MNLGAFVAAAIPLSWTAKRLRGHFEWTELNGDAPWAPRAGAVVVVKDDYMYLLGGEAGFLCDTQADPDCELP